MKIEITKSTDVRSPLGRKVHHINENGETIIVDTTGHIMGHFNGNAAKQLSLDLLASGFEDDDDAVLTQYIAAYWSAQKGA